MENRKNFETLLLHTGMLHFRMPVDEIKSLEHRLLQKPVTEKLTLFDGSQFSRWHQNGHGKIYPDEQKGIVLKAPARADHWPEGSPEDGDYCSFGALEASFIPETNDWRSFNRLHLKVYANCQGMHSPMLTIQLYNDGAEKIPDKYCREGCHIIHLKNKSLNDCIWEFPSLARDCVTRLSFQVEGYGKELSMEDTISFTIQDMELQSVPAPDHTLGWQCDEGLAAFSTSGYFSDGQKTAIAGLKTEQFSVCRTTDDFPVFTGIPSLTENEKGRFYLWDFSEVKEEGLYYLKSGAYTGSPFEISHHPLYEPVWKAVHFLYCERCGGPVGRGHGTCHGDILARHNGLSLAYAGGWHDAGDVSQQTVQTAEVLHALLETAEKVCEKEPSLYYRIMEESAWGLDFILRTRFGDGYRASSAGIRRWSNGLIGDMDDCEARVHNHAFENFLMAGVEAYAARVFKKLDPELSEKAYLSACEDFRWAEQQFAEKGIELPVFFEHSYSTSLSQFLATASWAGSHIYSFLKDPYFAGQAVLYAEQMLSCQETGESGCPLSGFFYREPDKKTIVHFNHQSREQIYMQALKALCQTQPEHRSLKLWEASMRLYAEYLKQIYSYGSPYGMLPAGIHKTDEYLDKKTFELLHLMTTYEEEKENYKAQLANAIPLNKDYCLRIFPIWFSFRGNTAVHLAAGKAASILGDYFSDPELTQIAREQLYWTFGKNPFGQSLMYGVGSNYAAQYGALNGVMAGSIPVGIETKENGDIPYFPMENNATYKEVWTTSVGRWLWLAADLY